MTDSERTSPSATSLGTEAAEPAVDAQPAVRVAPHALLQIRLLGGFEVRERDGDALRFATRKSEALLALLALRPGQMLGRDKLCGLLWPEVRDAQARHSLRQTLMCLRKALPLAALPLLRVQPRALGLDATRVCVDVLLVEQLLDVGSPESLLKAAQLYQGDLLDGMSIDEPPFEQWLAFERARLREAVSCGLHRLLELHTKSGQVGEAIQLCAKLLQLDPLREETHRTLMRLRMRQGRRSEALKQYHALVELLRAELGIPPEGETQELAAELERCSVAAIAPSQSNVSSASDLALPHERRGSLAPTIGRSAELSALDRALRVASSSCTGVALLLGEAGVGKTHLCEGFAAEIQATGARRVLRGRCFESEQVLPFSLWLNLLGDARVLDEPALFVDMPEPLRAELAWLLPESTALALNQSPTARSALTLFQALQLLLARLAEPTPLLLILEDLHWADEMSLRLLCFLARTHDRSPGCFVLATAREEELATTPFLRTAMAELDREQLLQRIKLAPLSEPDTTLLAQSLIASQGRAALSNARLEQIWALSEGNPLVVVESTRVLAEGAITQDVARLPVPERVRALILSRVARMSAAARDVLSLAAVVGRELELDLLRRPELDEATLVAAIEQLVDARLLYVNEQRIYFTHDRIRETVYEQLLPPRRRLAHAAAASALERQYAGQLEQVCGSLGYHHSKAGNAAASVGHLLRFSEQASRTHGVGEALSALDQALLDSAQLPVEQQAKLAVEIVLRQAFCLVFLGRFDELVARLREHQARLEALQNPWLSAGFHFWLGFALTILGRPRDAEPHARSALEHAEACAEPRLTAYAHGLLSYLCVFRGRFADGIRHGSICAALLTQFDDIPEAASVACVNLVLNRTLSGDWQSALAECEKAEAAARAVNNPRAQALVASAEAFILGYTNQGQAALVACRRALELSKDPFNRAHALVMYGALRLGNGEAPEAIPVLEQALLEMERHGIRIWIGMAMTWLAEAQLCIGAPAECERIATEALGIVRAAGDERGAACVLRVLGGSAQALGQRELAHARLHEALQLFERIDAPIDMGNTLVRLGELARSEAETQRAIGYLSRAREHFAAHQVVGAVEQVDSLLRAL